MSQMAGPPEAMRGPTIGEQLDTRLRIDAEALAHLTDRLATIGNHLAQQAVDLADFQQALAHLQRTVRRQS